MIRLEESHAGFCTTRATLLEALRAGDESARRDALDGLIRLYWPPVYAYLRRAGRTRDDAAEIAQGFFADVALRRDLFERARAERGRLRTLIVASLKNYVRDRHRRAEARGRAAPVCELEREEGVMPEVDGLGPDEAFDRRWALAVLEEAMERCRQHFHATGKPGHWAAFEARVLSPAIAGVGAVALERVAEEHGFRTAADAAAAVQVVRKRAAALLREVAAESAVHPGEQDEEHRLVLELLGR